jgi:FixJ family two-component response regulator
MRATSEPEVSLIGIVDDDSGVRESISSLVRSAGFQAGLFSSAEEIPWIRRIELAVCLILDVRMPRINGLDLQARLAEMTSRLPIIFDTGYADEDAKKRALDNGTVACLYKPFGDEALFSAIPLALNRLKTAEE